MKRLVRSSSFVAALLVVTSGFAEEDPPAPSTPAPTMWAQKPNAIRGIIGILGSPVGMLGVEVERMVTPWASVHGGVGLGGIELAQGPQIAAGASWLAFRGDRWSVGPAASLSFGNYREIRFEGEGRSVGGAVLWTNLEIFAAMRFHNAVDLRFAAGASIDTVCWGADCRSNEVYDHGRRIGGGNHSLGYTTAGLGYAW